MSNFNEPDDWNMWYTTCPGCGQRYHLSEGSDCGCLTRDTEQKFNDLVDLLKASHIDFVDYEIISSAFNSVDVLNDLLPPSTLGFRVYFTGSDNTEDEIVLSEKNYSAMRKSIKTLPSLTESN